MNMRAPIFCIFALLSGLVPLAAQDLHFVGPSTVGKIPIYCEGDGCDAYLPVQGAYVGNQDNTGEKRLNSALGGLAGGLIGEEIAGAPGAIAFGALGAALGWHENNAKRWEKRAQEYDAAWQRGDDTYYNPANRLPNDAHWMYAGPSIELEDIKAK
ncbi:hypothetical protein [Kordiimonas pumila]|uniref:Glycine zipper domain-containing protein n=1 Tax=Kordiimonas pumila TaxID=2161677 RepID=A0ABV7D168_9PROT|nr:hypothetical protein [Kordiimonas pumila]